jgi:hypothetical protein
MHIHERDLLTEAMDWMGSLPLIHIAEALHEPGLDLILSEIDASEAGILEREVGQQPMKHIVCVHYLIVYQIDKLNDPIVYPTAIRKSKTNVKNAQGKSIEIRDKQ